MLSFQRKPESRVTFEDIFFEHYSRLFEWALQLTNRNRFEAEDLVQELYIRFARLGEVGEHIENAKDYVFSVLRNLHYARMRRAKTSALDDLSVVDYESAERSLRAMDRGAILFVREDLCRVCDYFCERKKTSRSASIFIFRYFLGYFPNEVMKVVRCTRAAIDKAVQSARREARLELSRPGVLRQMSMPETNHRIPSLAEESGSLFCALRAKIFSSCSGECPRFSELESKYAVADQSCSTEELAHLVSCVDCLDHVNRFLGIPTLDRRSPDDTIGRDTPRGPGGSSGTTPRLVSRSRKTEEEQQRHDRMERRAQEAYEHRPQLISIAIDGDIRASQRVTARFSELRVELGLREKPKSVEVLSEQNICLAFLLVRALFPEENLRQSQKFELSDRRSLAIAVSFAPEAPTIQVVYRDPLLAGDLETEPTGAMETASMPEAEQQPIEPDRNEAHAIPMQVRVWQWLKRADSSRISPVLAGGIALGLCCMIAVPVWLNSKSRISPATLLQQAHQAEVAVSNTQNPGVICQKVRVSGGGQTLERVIHRDPAKKHKAKQQKLDRDAQRVKERLDLAGVDWEEPLSASNYSAWRETQPAKHDVVTRTGEDLLTLTTSSGAINQIIKESLTVRESDFHPVARTIELRDQGTIEIAELNYNVVPWSPASQEWFEPLPKAASDAPEGFSALGMNLPHSPSVLDLDDAELSVRYVLHRIGADLGDPIEVEIFKGTRATIRVVGAVSSRERKQELLSSLSRVSHVTVDVQSEDEANQRKLPAPVRNAVPLIVTSRSPIEKELNAYLGDPSTAENFSKQAIAISGDLMAHAWALRHLSERYGAPGLQRQVVLSPSSRKLLEAMREDHYGTMLDEASQLSTMLRPLLRMLGADSAESAPRLSLFSSAQQVQRLTLALLSGGESQDANEIRHHIPAARDLANALRGLEITLEETRGDRRNYSSFDPMHS